METTTLLVMGAAGVLLLTGFVLGNRFAELDMKLRERRVARQRRALHEAVNQLRHLQDASTPTRIGGRNSADVWDID